jgi:predicted exporter
VTRRAYLLGAWLAALAGVGAYAAVNLRVDTDLRSFLPSPATDEQQMLVQEIGSGPASRLLLIALENAPPADLAAVSNALQRLLAGDRRFAFVANGRFDAAAFPPALLSYRYLLTPRFDDRKLDVTTLRAALQARLKDLASPAASSLEDIVQRDPTLELANLATRWQPAREPVRRFDVWFDATRDRALLVAATVASGFDPAAQQAALAAIEHAFVTARGHSTARIVVSGPGAFSVLMQERTRSEAGSRGLLATAGVVLILWGAFRSGRSLALGVLPLAGAVLAGLAAVLAFSGSIHGITLAFGFTLLGVAQDYPIHLLAHLEPGVDALATARRIWSTLATGVVSTCIAYLTFVFSGVPGLEQLGIFTVTGLAVAALTTRYLLPHFAVPVATPARAADWLRRFAWQPPAPALAVGLAVFVLLAVGAVARSGTPFWEPRLASLTPVPAALLARDAELRNALGAPSVRYLLYLRGHDVDQVLGALESLDRALGQLVARGAIDSFDHAARYLPSRETQQRRQRALPDHDSLQRMLAAATAGLPFRPRIFRPFVADVETARELRPLELADLEHTPLAARLDSMLFATGGGSVALVTLSGVHDAAALTALVKARASTGVRLLDLTGEAEALVARQREHLLEAIAIAAVAMVLVVALVLRHPNRIARVIAPILLTLLFVVAALRGAGTSLHLFHLISLTLVAGLGLDYALFFERAAADPAERSRARASIAICAASTLMVFGLLATSSLPVLRAIGVTVALGVVLGAGLSAWLAAGGVHGRAA